MGNEGSQTSVAVAPPRNPVMVELLAGVPPAVVHSTLIGAGHVMFGCIVSTTVTVAEQVAVSEPASVAVKVTGVPPRGNRPGPLLERVGTTSYPASATTAEKNVESCGSPAGVPPLAEHCTVRFGAQVVMFGAKFTGVLGPRTTPPAWKAAHSTKATSLRPPRGF